MARAGGCSELVIAEQLHLRPFPLLKLKLLKSTRKQTSVNKKFLSMGTLFMLNRSELKQTKHHPISFPLYPNTKVVSHQLFGLTCLLFYIKSMFYIPIGLI